VTVRFLADENFNRRVVTGLRRRDPGIDLLRVQDVGLRTLDDAAVLAWAAAEGRVLLTHDAATMSDHAFDRVAAGLPMSGVFIVRDDLPVGAVIEDLLLVAELSSDDDWIGRVERLPL
jgi:predicted nuclease of predicted toxin-antitoxin system